MKRILYLFVFLFSFIAYSQQTPQTSGFDKMNDQLTHRLDIIQKSIDDVLWFDRVGDVAFVDKVYIVGPPRTNVKNSNAMGANNPLKFWAYVFIPRNIDLNKNPR